MRIDVTRWLRHNKNGVDAEQNETRNGNDGRDYLFCTPTAIRVGACAEIFSTRRPVKLSGKRGKITSVENNKSAFGKRASSIKRGVT